MESDIFKNITVLTVISWTSSGAMIFGGIIPYIPQYREIRKTQNTEGFSLYVCMFLLMANTLRILFWFGHHFELPLLIQSIVMNIGMLVLIHLCVHTRKSEQIIPGQQHIFKDTDMKESDEAEHLTLSILPSPRIFLDFDPGHFWNWTDFPSYIECLATFTLAMGAFLFAFMDTPLVVEALGFLAVFIEAMLGSPQFYRNFQNKSTIGMSRQMVLMWTVGDMFKTSYFIIREVPLQFCVCGVLQVGVDIAILLQILVYRGNAPPLKVGKRGPYTQ